MKVLKRLAMLCAALLVSTTAALAWLLSRDADLAGYAAHRYAPPPAGPGALTATWFGTSALLLSDGAHAVFVDPFFTRPGGWASLIRNDPIAPDAERIETWLRRAGVERLDAVLVSHSHYDHVMDAPAVALRTGAVLAGSPSTANVARGAGLPPERIHVVTPGTPFPAGSFRVTFVESRHAGLGGGRPTGEIAAPLVPPARFLDYRQGGTFSIVIGHAQGTVLHHGSAGFAPGSDALKQHRADVAFLGVALRPDWAAYLPAVVDATGARRVVPLHWDDFTRPLDAPLRALPLVVDLDGLFAFVRERRPDLAVQTLEPGVPVALFPERAQ